LAVHYRQLADPEPSPVPRPRPSPRSRPPPPLPHSSTRRWIGRSDDDAVLGRAGAWIVTSTGTTWNSAYVSFFFRCEKLRLIIMRHYLYTFLNICREIRLETLLTTEITQCYPLLVLMP